jgi:putative PIN family toxin of toxin-antitoxin system
MSRANKSVKVVIDTNIWISFLIGKSLNKLHKYIHDDRITVVTCNEQLAELTNVLNKTKIQKYFSPVQRLEFLELFYEIAEFVTLTTLLNICRDSKDNYLLSLAVDSQSDYLITGDLDLLILRQAGMTAIVNFTDFEKIMPSL